MPQQHVEHKAAAVYLLRDCWLAEAASQNLDCYHFIAEEGLLSVAEIEAVRREVWPSVKTEQQR